MISEFNIKEFLLKKYPNTEGLSYKRLELPLSRLRDFESSMNKPWEQFITSDFVKLFEDANWTAMNTFISNKSLIKEFAEWYFENIIGLRNIPFGHQKVSAIKYIELKDVSSKSRYEKEYFENYDDFMKCLEELYGTPKNDQYIMQQAFFALMWEGIDRNELKSIKKDDIECPPDEIKAIIHLQDKDVVITEERTVKIIRQAIGASGYDVVQKNGRGRAYQFANTEMLLRNTSKKSVSKDTYISESSINNYYTEQAKMADELSEKSPYHCKRLVFRGISDSGAFCRLVQDGNVGHISKDAIAKARQTNAVANSIVESFNFNYQGWRKHFGYE